MRLNTREVFKESVPVLSVCAAISVFSGLFLGKNEELLKVLPGILIIVPSFIAINGNVSSVVASRLSSALHMGLIKPNFRKSKTLEKNIYSMLVVSFAAFIFLGIAAGLANSFLGAAESSFIMFPLITLAAGLITVVTLMLFAIISSYIIYRKGIDPDNVVVPLLTTIGDFVGITVLLLITGVVI
jgi:mgtE-like transporter